MFSHISTDNGYRNTHGSGGIHHTYLCSLLIEVNIILVELN